MKTTVTALLHEQLLTKCYIVQTGTTMIQIHAWIQRGAARTTFPMHPCGPSPRIPLLCAHAALWGSCTAQVAPTAAAAAARRTAQKFLHRNGQVSEERFSFLFHFYDPQNNPGLDIRTGRADKTASDFGICVISHWLDLKIKLKRGVLSLSLALSCVWPEEKMCSSAQAARFAVVFLLFLKLQRGCGANTRTCPPPCVCIGELVDCSRLKRGQIPDTIPEWTVQL